MDFQTRVDATIDKAIAEDRIVGAVLIVARDGEVIYRRAAGHFDREAGTPMFPEAIFRLASVTKPLVAATALAMVDRSLLGLDNAVADHLPWFTPKLPDGRQPKITLRQLLTHTSGLSYDYAPVPGLTTGLQPTDLLWSFTEALAMAAAVMAIHTYYGYTVTGGPAGVGEAVGRAVRMSITAGVFILLTITLSVYGQSGNFHLSG